MSEKSAILETLQDPRTTSAETLTEICTEYIHHGGSRFAILTLENADRRPVTLGPESLNNVEAAVRALASSAVDAVAVTGTGSIFCAGADLRKMTEAVTREQAEDVASRGLEVLGQLEALPVPTFAFMNGIALGGVLELALHMRYRVATDSVRAVGFPEVRLGLVPGWGGIPRTAALLGPAMAARLVISDSLAGKSLSGRAAAELGLVDAVLPEDGFLTASLDFAAGILSGTVAPPPRAGNAQLELASTGGSAAPERVRAQLDIGLQGAAPAPYRALDLISAGPVGRDAQIMAFSELLLSDEARASIYA